MPFILTDRSQHFRGTLPPVKIQVPHPSSNSLPHEPEISYILHKWPVFKSQQFAVCQLLAFPPCLKSSEHEVSTQVQLPHWGMILRLWRKKIFSDHKHLHLNLAVVTGDVACVFDAAAM